MGRNSRDHAPHPNVSRVVSQSALLDLYIKSVLMSKTKPPQHLLDKSTSLLRHASHSDFNELLLPSMQKTMLRSPENAMRSETMAASTTTSTRCGGWLLTAVCSLSLSSQLCPVCCRPSL